MKENIPLPVGIVYVYETKMNWQILVLVYAPRLCILRMGLTITTKKKR